MKTLIATIIIALSTLPAFAESQWIVSKPNVVVFEKNHGKGKEVCKLKRNDKVSSKWDNNKWILINSKISKCEGWVSAKDLKQEG